MTLFTSISATTSYVIFGLLMWDYAVVCFAIGFCACMFGQRIMYHAKNAGGLRKIQNFERNSVIAYSIGIFILLSALLMTVLYVLTIVSFDDDGDSGGICEGYARVSA